jgi:proteasome lid subunit RPN8/RPN11
MTDSTTTLASERDISAIDYSEWPMRDLERVVDGRREGRFQMVFKQSVLDEIHLHGQMTTDVEVCGVMVGNGYQDAHGPYLLVEHCIRGSKASSKATNVTFTSDTWQHIHEAMDRDHPNLKILGWYHTHPGFGIFLSDMDIFICNHFFNLPWQSAFVYDPISGEEGNFIWRNGRPEKDPVLIEADVTPESAQITLISTTDAIAGSAAAEVIAAQSAFDPRLIELLVRVRRLERRQRVMLWLAAFAFSFIMVGVVEFVGLVIPGLSFKLPAQSPAPTTRPAASP